MPMRIKLLGEEYWFLGEDFTTDAAIAPIEHCDEKGSIVDLRTIFTGTSFAHYYPNEGVMRYGTKIANREDIKVINACIEEVSE